jgi:hypothetical protein
VLEERELRGLRSGLDYVSYAGDFEYELYHRAWGA